jgi:hypothetical protein
MSEESKKQKDLEEISSHVKKLIDEKNINSDNQDRLDPFEIIKNKTDIIAGDIDLDKFTSEDFFEIVKPIKDEVKDTSNLSKKSISTMQIESTGDCDICKQKIVFERNLSGLVIHGRFFACEKCCQDASKDDLSDWAETKTAKPEDVKPIALWLMQEKNKTRLF